MAEFGFDRDMPALQILPPKLLDSQPTQLINKAIEHIMQIDADIKAVDTNTFKILDRFNVTLTFPTITGNGTTGASDTQSFQTGHGLTYAPAVMAFVQIGGKYYPVTTGVFEHSIADSSATAIKGIFTQEFQISTDFEFLYISGTRALEGPTSVSVAGAAYVFKYYILREPAV